MDTTTVKCDTCGEAFPTVAAEVNECANNDTMCPDCRRAHLLFCGVCS